MSHILRQLEVEQRLRRLPERCRMLADGLDNSENDPELLFAGLPFADVLAAAQRDPHVHAAVERLRPDQFARLFRVEHGRATRQPGVDRPTPTQPRPAPARLGGVQL